MSSSSAAAATSGLPLSLAFAKAGLCVGIYDTNQATLDRIAAGQMPFLETGADELLAEMLPTGRLVFGSSGSMIERTDNLVVVIGTPVDEFLGPSMTIFEKAVDQIAPHLRTGALVALRSTVYPGTTGYVAQHLAARGCVVDVAFCPERIAEGHALEELHSLPADHRRRRRSRSRAGDGALRAAGHQDDPDDDEGSRADQALHQHVAVHEVRGREPVLHDRRPGRRGLHERPARDPRGLPARRATCPAPASPPVRACSRTRCSWPRSRPTISRWARRRCRSTRACPRTSSRRSNVATAVSRGKTVGILGMAFKAESDDPRASLSYKLRKLLAWAGATVVCTDPYVTRRPARPAGDRPGGERHPDPRRAAQAVSIARGRRQGRRRRLGRPRRRDPAVVRILVTGAAGFINGYLVPELLEAGHEVIGLDDFSKYGRLAKSYDDHPRYRFVEGDAKDADARSRELAADCDQVVAAAAMIGGISYFHEFAYDLLAENERILAVDLRRGDRRPRDGHLERIIVVSSSMVYESATVFPTPGGRPADLAAAGLDLRLPEARLGVLRQGRLGAVPAAVHDRAAVQLRRHRRAPGAPRHGHHERQREARPEPRRPGSRAQGPQGPGSAAHPRRGRPGPALHLRRRPRPRHPSGDGVAEGAQRRLQPLDRRVDDGARAGRVHLAQDPHGRPSRSATSAMRPSSTTSSCACRTSARPARSSASRRRRRSTQMLDEVIPWIRAESEAGRL